MRFMRDRAKAAVLCADLESNALVDSSTTNACLHEEPIGEYVRVGQCCWDEKAEIIEELDCDKYPVPVFHGTRVDDVDRVLQLGWVRVDIGGHLAVSRPSHHESPSPRPRSVECPTCCCRALVATNIQLVVAVLAVRVDLMA